MNLRILCTMVVMSKVHANEKPVHRLPEDFRKAIFSHKAVATLWEDITPLARNEWICWVTSAKKEETRIKRIEVGLDKMRKGMRRPCCWAGCPHR
jgi:uncharacterized protein YdeI (YjbR/CyaY-like superfamily)